MKKINIKISQFILVEVLLIILGSVIIYNQDFYFKTTEVASESTVLKSSKDKEYQDFKYIEEDGKIFIKQYTGSEDPIIIPDKIEGKPVMGLKNNAFTRLSSIGSETIVFSKNIQYIEENTFADCNFGNFKKVEVPDENKHFKSIDGVLFNKDQTILYKYPAKKDNLEYEVPKGVKKIAKCAFNNCKNLKSIILPEGLTIIGEMAFESCENIKEINLPEGIIKIDDIAFVHCINLEKVKIPSSLIDMGKRVFYLDSNLGCIEVSERNKEYKSVDGVLYDKTLTTLFLYPAQKNTDSYVIPESVKVIKEFAFLKGKHLEKIILPEGLKEIETCAFQDCTNLDDITLPEPLRAIGSGAFAGTKITHIKIPKGVSEMGSNPFTDCKNLQDIEVDEKSPYFSAIDKVLFDKAQKVLIAYPAGYKQADYIIPDGTIEIRGEAFSGNKMLKNVTVPKSVIEIGLFSLWGGNNPMTINGQAAEQVMKEFYAKRYIAKIDGSSKESE